MTMMTLSLLLVAALSMSAIFVVHTAKVNVDVNDNDFYADDFYTDDFYTNDFYVDDFYSNDFYGDDFYSDDFYAGPTKQPSISTDDYIDEKFTAGAMTGISLGIIGASVMFSLIVFIPPL